VLAAGKTPAGMHRPIMADEVLRCLRLQPGDTVVDCTLGGGGHAQAILERIRPGGRPLGIDVDPIELPRTEARLRAAGYGPDELTVRAGTFAAPPQALAGSGLTTADAIVAALGVSSMQLDNPDRGFTYKADGPLDMRLNPARGEPASALITRVSEAALATLLSENADEPNAPLIAALLKRHPPRTRTTSIDWSGRDWPRRCRACRSPRRRCPSAARCRRCASRQRRVRRTGGVAACAAARAVTGRPRRDPDVSLG
jgi:16S rRNA (cytosine1402-N4)-methyltransferase